MLSQTIGRIQQKEQVSLSYCCRLFGISRQAIYQSRNRLTKREQKLLKVKHLVVTTRMKMPRLGARKLYYLVKEQLLELNIKLGRDALFDYLRRENLLIFPKKNYIKTTNSKHWMRKHPNLLKDKVINGPEQVFVSDITYIKSKERTHYLSLVTDAYSRKIMGHKFSDDMRAEHMVDAFKNAVGNRKLDTPVIHHSDRGLQYCSEEFQNVLKQNNGIASMTDGYDCYQNALAERMNGILKQEFLIHKCNNGKELSKLINQSIDVYNQNRPHLSLKMKTPNFVHEKTEEDILFGLN